MAKPQTPGSWGIMAKPQTLGSQGMAKPQIPESWRMAKLQTSNPEIMGDHGGIMAKPQTLDHGEG